MVEFINEGTLPTTDDALTCRIVYEAEWYICLNDGILWQLRLPRNKKQRNIDPLIQQIVVPRALRETVLKAYHDITAMSELRRCTIRFVTSIFGRTSTLTFSHG